MLAVQARHTTAGCAKERAPADRVSRSQHQPSANPLWSSLSTRACMGAVQAKLQVGPPGDRCEQEADRMADQVVPGRQPVAARVVGACESPVDAGEALPALRDVLRSPGQPLDTTPRRAMETRFGADFTGVRIHVGGRAAESASALGARAYTVGRDVVFGAGEYAPLTSAGGRLLAHELTHVVQQGPGIRRTPLDRDRGDASPPPPAPASGTATQAAAGRPQSGPYPPVYWGRERPLTTPVAIARAGARLDEIAEYLYGSAVAALDLASLNGLTPEAPLDGGVVLHTTGEPLTDAASGSLSTARLLPANCGDPDAFTARKRVLDAELELDFKTIVDAIEKTYEFAWAAPQATTRFAAIFRKWGEETFTEYPWAYPNGGDYLDRLFLKLTNKTKILSGIFTDEWTNYYSLLFNRYDVNGEIAAIRDRYTVVNRGDSGVPELSFASMFWEDVKSGKVRDRIFAFGRGVVTGVKSAAKGTVDFVKTLVTDPGKALDDLSKIPGALESLWEHRGELLDKFLNASPEEQAEMIGQLVGQLEFAIATSPVPGAAVKGLEKVARVPGLVGTTARALTTATKVPGKVLGAATGAVKTVVFKGVAFAVEGATWAAKGVLYVAGRILRGTWSVIEETVGAVKQKLYYFYDDASGAVRRIQESIAARFVKCTSPCELTPDGKPLAPQKAPSVPASAGKFADLAGDEAKRLGSLSREAIDRMRTLPADVAQRLLKLDPDTLAKLTVLGPHELTKLSRLSQTALEMFAKLEPQALAYVADLSTPALEWLARLKPATLAKIAEARIMSPFSLRQLVEKIRPTSSAREVNKALAKAERHRAQLEKAFKAAEAGDWSKISGRDRSSIGRHIGYELEELARVISRGRAKSILNYELVNKRLITNLAKDRGRILITQGRLKGGDLRFDLAEIDFDKRTVELIDLAPQSNPAHLAGTRLYRDELQKLLPDDFTFIVSEQHYVGAAGEVLEDLAEVLVP